jgi:surface polysaccharide O-acyltransferase-like enzyme
MKKLRLNYAAIAVAIILAMVVPAVGYGIFADPWMEANNLTLAEVESRANPVQYVIALISSVVTVYIMAWLFTKLNVNNLTKGIAIALILGLGFYFTTAFTSNVFSFRPRSLIFIDGGITLVSYMVTGGILGAWKKYEEKV